ncbi:MAG: hypothetical protein ACP5HK_06930, partial [Acidilobus sp.]
ASPGYAVVWLTGPIYGFVPFYIGDAMQGFVVVPPVLLSPGSAYPGGWVLVAGVPLPPVETLFMPSSETGEALFWAAMYGSNVTAYLMATNGTIASSAQLPLTGEGYYMGLLPIPSGLKPGYYVIYIVSSYNSSGAGLVLRGLGFDEIYVVPPLTANVTLAPTASPLGGPLRVEANITYNNGTPVACGVFSATLIPAALAGLYENVSQSVEVPLMFNLTSRTWIGELSLPGPSALGNATYYEAPFSGSGTLSSPERTPSAASCRSQGPPCGLGRG